MTFNSPSNSGVGNRDDRPSKVAKITTPTPSKVASSQHETNVLRRGGVKENVCESVKSEEDVKSVDSEECAVKRQAEMEQAVMAGLSEYLVMIIML